MHRLCARGRDREVERNVAKRKSMVNGPGACKTRRFRMRAKGESVRPEEANDRRGRQRLAKLFAVHDAGGLPTPSTLQ